MAVGEVLVLHKDEVPDFYDVGVGLVDQVAAGAAASGFLLGTADVDVDLGAGAAGTGVAHLPEVVVLVAEEDVVLGEVLEPGFLGFLVHLGPVFGRTLEHSGVEEVLVDFIDLGEKLPGPVDGFFLEVIAVAPVAEHLEHSVVVGVVAHLFEVVVLSADSQALLGVGGALVWCGLVAEENVLELVHPGIGKHKRRVVLYDHRGGGHDDVLLGGEEVEELLPYFFRCKHSLQRY